MHSVRNAACCTSTCFSDGWKPMGTSGDNRSPRRFRTLRMVPESRTRRASTPSGSCDGELTLAFGKLLHRSDEGPVAGAGYRHVLIPVHQSGPWIMHVVESGDERDHCSYFGFAVDHVPATSAENDDLGEIVRDVHQEIHRVPELHYAEIEREYFREAQFLLEHSRHFRLRDPGNEHVDARLPQ